MELAIIIIFVLGYLCIALEHVVSINKTASALLTGVLCWTLLVFADPSEALLGSELYTQAAAIMGIENPEFTNLDAATQYREFALFELTHHLASIAQIIFFLMGAMTIVFSYMTMSSAAMRIFG